MADKKKQNSGFFVILTLILVVTGILIGYFVLTGSGEKSGVEYSPDDFSMRRFDYNRIPLLNWTRRGIDHDVLPFATGQTLVADDWIRATGRTPKRWHLVSESRVFTDAALPAECDARFLTDYLELTNVDGETIVLKWTDANPESAKILWPHIAELARNRVYLPIPKLLDFALSYSKADKEPEFVGLFEKRVANAWTHAAQISQNKGEHSRAVALFDRAIEIGGENESVEEKKAKSLSLIGDGEKE